MGCDIHTRAEKRVNGKWEVLDFQPFDWRGYGMFAFLAGVRNYSAIMPIAEPRGIPDDEPIDAEDEPWLGEHSFSWLTLDELARFNYDREIEDRRVTRQVAPNVWDGGQTAEPGGGEKMTLREFLGGAFFDDLKKLQELGAERVVFGFDS